MAKVTIKDVNPLFDGEHELDETYFTNGELHAIKKQTGLRAGEIEEAADAGDNDLIVALAAIALERKGIKHAYQILWNAKAGVISVDFGSGSGSGEDEQTEEEEELPPPNGPVAE